MGRVVFLAVLDRHVSQIALTGRGVFRAVLSVGRATHALLQRSPMVLDWRLIILRPWYPELSAQDFETRFDISRFPMTVAFPSLAFQFRHFVIVVAS